MKKFLYNPLNDDFSVKYDINGDLNPEEFVISGMSLESFEEPLYSHMKKHLITFIANKREVNPSMPLILEGILKEIEAEI
jgi:hypothetical protein